MSEKRYRPFHSGCHAIDWEASNCDRCEKRKYNKATDAIEMGNCEIDDALTYAYLDDGTVSEEIARRMGYLTEANTQEYPYTWPCGEVKWTKEWKAESLKRMLNA